VNPHLAWYAARAAGIVAWALLSASVIWGLLLSTRLLHGRPTPRWLLDLHRVLGGLAVTFTAVHIGGLVADNYLHFGVADLLVPFASSWRPGAVALGVVGLWLLLAVEITSLLMRWLPRRLWHGIHLSSYVLFWTATLHGLLAGTDAHQSLYTLATNSVVTLVLFLTLVRVLASPRRARSARARHPEPASARAGAPGPTSSSPTNGDTEVLPAVSALAVRAPQPPGWAPAAPAWEHRSLKGSPLERRTGAQPHHGVAAPPRPAPPEHRREDRREDRSPAERDALAERARALAARRQPTPEQRQALAARRAAARDPRAQPGREPHPARPPRAPRP
jgi:hypothetical protein